MTLLNPWVLLAALVAAISLLAGGYAAGHRAASTACTAAQVSAQNAEIAHAASVTEQRQEVGSAREVVREQIRVVYQKLEEQANDGRNDTQVGASGVAGAGCGLDADRLRLWNAANSGAASTVPAQPDYRLPVADSGKVGQLNGLAGQPYRGDGAVRAVPRPVEQAGGVRGDPLEIAQ